MSQVCGSTLELQYGPWLKMRNDYKETRKISPSHYRQAEAVGDSSSNNHCSGDHVERARQAQGRSVVEKSPIGVVAADEEESQFGMESNKAVNTKLVGTFPRII